MKSAIYLFVLLMFAMLCNAQQSIILSSNSNGEISDAQSFKLPIKVHCKFKNKSSKTLVLERVNGDSLIFKSEPNQINEYNCLYSYLKSIQFHNNAYHSKHLIARVFTGIALFTTAFMVYGISKKNTENSVNQLAAVISFPVMLISTSLSIISIANLPPKYSYSKYSLTVK
jgi:hypothetical protein